MTGRLPMWRRVRSVGQRTRRKVGESGVAYTTQLAIQRVVPGWLFDVSALWLCQRLLDAEVPAIVDDEFQLRSSAEVEELVAQGLLGDKLAAAVADPTAIVWTLHRGADLVGSFRLERESYRPFHMIRIDLQDDEIVGDEVFVVPRRRGQGLGPHMNRLVAHHYRCQGMRRVVSVVDVLNRNALRMDEKVGYQRLSRLVIVRLVGLTLVVHRRRARFGRFTAERPCQLSIPPVQPSGGPGRPARAVGRSAAGRLGSDGGPGRSLTERRPDEKTGRNLRYP